jgi:hypothetical protein
MSLRRLMPRLEAECKTVLRTEASAAFTGRAPVTIRPDVAKFTWEKTGSEQGGIHESEPFVRPLPLDIFGHILTMQFELVDVETNGAHKQ